LAIISFKCIKQRSARNVNVEPVFAAGKKLKEQLRVLGTAC